MQEEQRLPSRYSISSGPSQHANELNTKASTARETSACGKTCAGRVQYAMRRLLLTGGSARLCALATVVRLDPHIFAIVARLLSFIPYGHERISERL